MSALEEAGEDYENKWAVFSVYNAPWELKDRHNEVSIRTSQRTAGCRCFFVLFPSRLPEGRRFHRACRFYCPPRVVRSGRAPIHGMMSSGKQSQSTDPMQ